MSPLTITFKPRVTETEVRMGASVVAQLADYIKNLPIKKVVLIADEGLTKYQQQIESLLNDAGVDHASFHIAANEIGKSSAGLEKIYQFLFEVKANRETWVLALGGGSIGDVAGYAAATYMRGIPWVVLPTTLLAQVDSAIGGKTAINVAEAKNVVGAIHQPSAVFCDFDWLHTLPPRDWVSGAAEIVKAALIGDAKLFDQILKCQWQGLDTLEESLLSQFIARSIAVKANFVSEDQYEQNGKRVFLNFGHTIAHALERVTGYGVLRHGEAVFYGMKIALALSKTRKLLSEQDAAGIESLISRFPLPALPARLSFSQLHSVMRKDKKQSQADSFRFVLLQAIGSPIVIDDITATEIEAALACCGVSLS